MGVSAAKAVERARLNVVSRQTPQGMCLNWVWRMFGALPSTGYAQGTLTTALNAWNSSAHKRTDRKIPVGAPVYFGSSPTRWDKNKHAGDVTIHVGSGILACTDVNGANTGYMTIDARSKQIQRPYLGYTLDFGGRMIDFENVIPATPKPPTPIRTDDDEMLSPEAQEFLREVIRDEINNNTNTNAASIKESVRRDGRYRLYKNAETGQFKAVNWDLPTDDPARVIYPNDEAHLARMYDPYQLIGDSVAQAQVLLPFEWESLGRLADGTDIAYREDKSQPAS